MIDSARVTRIMEHLFRGGGDVYAVLDAARDPRVYGAVEGSGLPHACLYDGKLPAELAEAAPHLVRLRADRPFTAKLLADGWGDSWGCFMTTSLALPELRRHLRRFLRVKNEEGKTLVFRYYDPRVLRTYLPTCTPDELATFFGPVSRFIVESDGGSAALAFERHGTALSFARLELVPPS
jgi:hypothetical protein